MVKIAVNRCFGGFSLSEAAYNIIGVEWDGWGYAFSSPSPQCRTNPKVIQAIEELGDDASGMCAQLAIVEIPDDVDWEIDSYDGRETVVESHRTW